MNPEFQIPNSVKDVLLAVHNSMVGHFGEEITLERLKEHGVEEKYLREYVRKFLRECPCCQKQDALPTNIQTAPFFVSTLLPMQQLNVDTIGPLPLSKYGFKYILVMIDTFTRYVELYPIRDLTAEEAVDAFIQQFGRWGVPSVVQSDGGSQFHNRDIQELLSYVTVLHNITVPYSKQENSIVERANKEVMRHLRAIVLDTRIKENWAVYIPFVQRIINAKKHESTGVAPIQLIAVNLDLESNILHAARTQKATDFGSYFSDMIQRQRTVIEVAQKHQIEKIEEHMSSKASSPVTLFHINAFVLVAYPEGHRPDDKLMCRWYGPMQIVDIVGDAYHVRDLVTMNVATVHVSRLKAFRQNGLIQPDEVAYAEGCVWEVLRVHKHRKEGKSRQGVFLLIEWVGFPQEKHWTWEQWSASLGRNASVIEYLSQHKELKHMISTSFKK
jgi:dihydroneopterin aldolase